MPHTRRWRALRQVVCFSTMESGQNSMGMGSGSLTQSTILTGPLILRTSAHNPALSAPSACYTLTLPEWVCACSSAVLVVLLILSTCQHTACQSHLMSWVHHINYSKNMYTHVACWVHSFILARIFVRTCSMLCTLYSF